MRERARPPGLAWLAALCVAAWPLPRDLCRAQDFAAPEPPRGAEVPASFLERGLPPVSGAPAVQALATSWFGVPDLTTRALAFGAGWREARAAAGLAQTGDAEIGWTTAALALGAATDAAGAGLRASARRDRDATAMRGALGSGAGVEVGGGAWVRAAAGITVGASAPQLWRRGLEAPLARGLEIGATWVMDDLALRLGRVASRGGAGAAQHEAVLALAAGALQVWLGARDQPLRGSLGVGGRAGPVALAAVVESHPVLGETVRLSLALGRQAR